MDVLLLPDNFLLERFLLFNSIAAEQAVYGRQTGKTQQGHQLALLQSRCLQVIKEK